VERRRKERNDLGTWRKLNTVLDMNSFPQACLKAVFESVLFRTYLNLLFRFISSELKRIVILTFFPKEMY
jgi:hypothetical protein